MTQRKLAADQLDLTAVVPLTGTSMTGPLVLSGDPTDPLGAATKQYVDQNAGGGGVSFPLSTSTLVNTHSADLGWSQNTGTTFPSTDGDSRIRGVTGVLNLDSTDYRAIQVNEVYTDLGTGIGWQPAWSTFISADTGTDKVVTYIPNLWSDTVVSTVSGFFGIGPLGGGSATGGVEIVKQNVVYALNPTFSSVTGATISDTQVAIGDPYPVNFQNLLNWGAVFRITVYGSFTSTVNDTTTFTVKLGSTFLGVFGVVGAIGTDVPFKAEFTVITQSSSGTGHNVTTSISINSMGTAGITAGQWYGAPTQTATYTHDDTSADTSLALQLLAVAGSSSTTINVFQLVVENVI